MEVPTEFDWDDTKAARNARERDGEDRQKIIGRLAGRLFVVVFVMRGTTCRLISARRTNSKEDRTYGDR